MKLRKAIGWWLAGRGLFIVRRGWIIAGYSDHRIAEMFRAMRQGVTDHDG